MSEEHLASFPGQPVEGHGQFAHPKEVFTEEEKDILRAEDKSACAAIVLLMSGVFAVGLIMYIVVAYMVSLPNV